jgi:hypothetical protein
LAARWRKPGRWRSPGVACWSAPGAARGRWRRTTLDLQGATLGHGVNLAGRDASVAARCLSAPTRGRPHRSRAAETERAVAATRARVERTEARITDTQPRIQACSIRNRRVGPRIEPNSTAQAAPALASPPSEAVAVTQHAGKDARTTDRLLSVNRSGVRLRAILVGANPRGCDGLWAGGGVRRRYAVHPVSGLGRLGLTAP